MYCTYLTVYSGNKLPPFYIGYSSVDKVKNGYHGSVQSKKYGSDWKKELNNNPHLFKTIIVSQHDTREEASSKEEMLQRKLNVVKNPLYMNRNISGNTFINEGHSIEARKKISLAGYNRKVSDETREKMSRTKLGKINSPEHRRKNSIAMTGRVMSEKTKKKISEVKTGSKHTEETKRKMSLSRSKSVTDGSNIFVSVKEAANYHKLHYTTVSSWASKKINNWSFVNSDK